MKEFTMKDSRRLIIRETSENEAEEVILYMKTMLGETDYLSLTSKEFEFTEEEERHAIRGYLEAANRIMISAVLDDKIIGMLTYDGGKRKRIQHTGTVGVSVLKAYWSKNIATTLFKYLFDWAKNNGITKKINLSVREDNLRAIELYRRLGFKVEGEESMKHFTNGKYYSSIYMGRVV